MKTANYYAAEIGASYSELSITELLNKNKDVAKANESRAKIKITELKT